MSFKEYVKEGKSLPNTDQFISGVMQKIKTNVSPKDLRDLLEKAFDAGYSKCFDDYYDSIRTGTK